MNRLAPPNSTYPGSAPPSAPSSDASAPAVPDHELLRRIGAGSYGEVWLARTILGEWRAVKVIRRAAFGSDARPFERELAGIRRYEPVSRSDPSQVAILHVGRAPDDSLFYYVMELADPAGSQFPATGGQDQRGDVSKIHTLRSGGGFLAPDSYTPRTLGHDLKTRGRLPVTECVGLGLALTRALERLHEQGLVHRDVKPSNIIFVGGHPKLADIGLVAFAAVGDDAGSIVGTEGYLAPEGPGTPQADLYALGRVLYEAASGRDRRDFPDLPHGWPETPEPAAFLELNEIIVTACATDPRERYPSADAMRADLERLRQGESIRRRQAWRRGLRLCRKLALAAGIVVLLAVGLNVFRDRSQPRTSIARATSSSAETIETSGTTNREAFHLYLLGQKCNEQANPSGYLRGIEYFEKAIALDPMFARAYAAMARAWGRLDAHEHTAPKTCQPKAREAALKALALDDTLVEARIVLANHLATFAWDWEGSERELRHAVRLAQTNPNPSGALAHLLAITGRHDEAIAILREQQRRHPDAIWINNMLGECLSFAGRHAEGEQEVRKTFAITPNDPLAHFRLAEVLWAMGRHEEALSEWERWSVLVNGTAGSFGEAHQAFRDAGLAGFWQFFDKQHNAELSVLKPGVWFPPMNCVWTYAGTGELDKAFEWLDRACEDKQPLLAYVAVHPHYATLWPDPRFKTLLKRMGLDRYFRERMRGASARHRGAVL